MKKFRRLPSIECLEQKRVKAADLAACPAGDETAALEAEDTASAYVSTSGQLRASIPVQLTTSAASAEEQDDGGDNGENGDDNGDNGDDNGENGDDNGDNGDDNEDNGDDNGDNGDDNGENGDDNGDNGDDNGDNGDDNGDNGDDNGDNGDDNGDNGDDNGENGDDNGENGDDNGENGEDNGDNGEDNGDNGDENGENGDDNGDSGDDNGDNSDTDDNGDSDDDNETELTAPLEGTGGGTASVEMESEGGSTETEFKVNVTGATASTTLQVTVDGTVVGSIMTDAQGNGSLKLASNADDDEDPLPPDFPTISANSMISIGEAGQTPILTGTFAASPQAASLTSGTVSGGNSTAGLLVPNLISSSSAVVARSGPAAATLPRIDVANPSAAGGLDANLVDALFATPDDDRESLSEFQPNVASDEGDGSKTVDAALENVVEGETAAS